MRKQRFGIGCGRSRTLQPLLKIEREVNTLGRFGLALDLG